MGPVRDLSHHWLFNNFNRKHTCTCAPAREDLGICFNLSTSFITIRPITLHLKIRCTGNRCWFPYFNVPYTMCVGICNTDRKSNETSIMLSSRYVYCSHSSLCMRSHVCWGSDAEKGMHASVRVLVLGACVCVCVTQIPTLYPKRDRDRTNENNADCCGCTCQWWTDGRQTIFRETERRHHCCHAAQSRLQISEAFTRK